jgi:hypothetical protein
MKRLAIMFLAVLCAAALLPQSLSAGIGIKGGYSLSKFAVTSVDPIPFTFGNSDSIAGGIFFTANLGFISLQPELLYVRMGAEYEIDEDNGVKWQLDYIQLPVLLKLSIVPAGPIRPFIYAGGYGSYLLKAKGIMTVGGVDEAADLTDDYPKIDYGAVGGVGLAFKLPGIAISIEGRYNYGLKNIIVDPLPGESLKNRSMMALVGIGF